MSDTAAHDEAASDELAPSARAMTAELRSNHPPDPPPPAIRGGVFFQAVHRAFAWLDGGLARWLPVELNPLAQAGAAANFALVVAVVSGVLMLLWYSPSVQFAYSSLAAIPGGTAGGWVRAIHRYSSDLAMLMVLVHGARVFFAGKFSGARWLPWMSGVAMLGLVWLIGWTGYWLVWDRPAQHVALSSMRLLDALPIFGEPLGRLFLLDRTVPSLLFFVVFFLHMLLPLAIAVGLVVHLARVSRARLLPGRGLSFGLLAGLAIAASVMPAPLDAAAQMTAKAEHLTVDAWYLSPLALSLRLRASGLWLALGSGTALAMLLPWLLDRRRAPTTFQAVVNPARCHACTQCVQDCPFDAIAMVARTDGKAFPAQAYVDPARCVGCGVCAGSCDSSGIVLTWFDTRVQETRLGREIDEALTRERPAWVALVAADIPNAGCFSGTGEWRQRLAGFEVHAVPTASWVRPHFVERLLAGGVRGVLVVRDATAEASARDGGRWVEARLAGNRQPAYRPERAGAGGGAWRVVDFDPARPHELARIATEFKSGIVGAARRGRWQGVVTLLAMATLLTAVMLAVVGPSRLRVINPGSAGPELVFSFKALGERAEMGAPDPAADAAKPVHMRGGATGKARRAPVVVRLTIDGVAEERSFAAKGVSHDGPAIGELRRAFAPGERHVAIEILTGGNAVLRWEKTVFAVERRINVVTYEPGVGFRLE